MQSATLLAAENKTLRAANEKVRKKRVKKQTYVGRGGVLIPIEALEGHISVGINPEVEDSLAEQITNQPIQRALRLCSICRSSSLTTRTCSER